MGNHSWDVIQHYWMMKQKCILWWVFSLSKQLNIMFIDFKINSAWPISLRHNTSQFKLSYSSSTKLFNINFYRLILKEEQVLRGKKTTNSNLNSRVRWLAMKLITKNCNWRKGSIRPTFHHVLLILLSNRKLHCLKRKKNTKFSALF